MESSTCRLRKLQRRILSRVVGGSSIDHRASRVDRDRDRVAAGRQSLTWSAACRGKRAALCWNGKSRAVSPWPWRMRTIFSRVSCRLSAPGNSVRIRRQCVSRSPCLHRSACTGARDGDLKLRPAPSPALNPMIQRCRETKFAKTLLYPESSQLASNPVQHACRT